MFGLAMSDVYFIQIFMHTLPQPPDIIKHLSFVFAL